MPMNNNPDEINDAQRYVESVLFKEGQDYAERNKRSKVENKGRAESRKRVKETGVNVNAYHTAVRLIKDLSARELKEWRRDLDITLKVLGSKQTELFPEEALKSAKREADRKAREAEEKTKRGVDADTNPRSDPNRGGAAKKAKEVPTPGPTESPDLKQPPNPPGEQAEGEAALSAVDNLGKKSQSTLAAEALEKAKLN